MPSRKPKDSNLSLLIQAIASAYHRSPDGVPRYQPIALRTKGVIASATVHLWRHSGVRNVTGLKLQALAAAYDFDFAKLINLVYGPPTRLTGDDLLASIRPDVGGQAVRPIRGGSAGPLPPGVDASSNPAPIDPLPVALRRRGRNIMSTWRAWRRLWLAWPLNLPRLVGA